VMEHRLLSNDLLTRDRLDLRIVINREKR